MGLFKKKGRLNPSQRGRKYASELKEGVECTHTGKIYQNKNGEVFPLSDRQKSYRHGYLDARRDNANAWKSKQAKNQGRSYNGRTNPRFK